MDSGSGKSSIAPNGSRFGALGSYKDITDLFTRATGQLGVGELLKEDGFTFVDGMTAIEILDPKMDSGMILPEESREVLISEGVKNLKLAPAEILGIMDAMLAQEELWQSGELLCQTVFTNVLLHRLTEVGDSVTKAYLLSTLKTIGVARDMVMGTKIFTEEDFTADTSGFSLCEGVPEQTMLEALKNAEDEVNKRIKAAGSALNTAGGDVAVLDAIITRIRFRRSYLQLITQLAKGDAKGFGAAGKLLANAKLQLELATTTLDLAADYSQFFDERLNRPLYTNGPPRKPPKTDIKEAFKLRKAFLEDLECILGVTSQGSMVSLMSHLFYFGLRTPTPNVVARSILVCNLVNETQLLGRFDLSKIAQEGVEQLTAPPYPTSNVKDVKNRFTMFVKRCELPIMYLLRNMCHSRPRQRRILQKCVLEWEQLQAEAEELDTKLQETIPSVSKEAFYLSSWVYHIKLLIMDMVVTAGFELELYTLHEFPLVFAVWSHIADSHLGHLERTENLRKEDRAARKMPSNSAVALQFQIISSQKLIRGLIWNLARGYLFLTAALTSMGAIREPIGTEEQARIRFHQRFRAFQSLGSPIVLTYEDYKRAVDAAKADPKKALQESIDLFQNARLHLNALNQRTPAESQSDLCRPEYLNNVQTMVKTVIANQVAARVAISAIPPDSNTSSSNKISVSAEPKHHRWLPTISVTVAK